MIIVNDTASKWFEGEGASIQNRLKDVMFALNYQAHAMIAFYLIRKNAHSTI